MILKSGLLLELTFEGISMMRTMLIIDDCSEFRNSLSILLREMGYQVLEASGPLEAKYAVSQHTVDLVICDLAMPLDVDEGEEVLDSGNSMMVGISAIKELSENMPMVPVIAVSGAVSGRPLAALDRFGAKAVLAKPVSLVDLRTAIDEAFGCWAA